jgi:nitrite transporter NirC
LFGNLVGSIALAALVHGGGTLKGDGAALVTAVTDAKDALTGPQLFWRAVLCNLLVCLGLWMASRVQSDAAKAIVVWWALLAFIGSGFEHSIANMTIFSLGIFQGTATAGELARNLLWTVPGNVVGGGVLVGLVYAWIGHTKPAVAAVEERPALEEQPPQPVPVLATAASSAG